VVSQSPQQSAGMALTLDDEHHVSLARRSGKLTSRTQNSLSQGSRSTQKSYTRSYWWSHRVAPRCSSRLTSASMLSVSRSRCIRSLVALGSSVRCRRMRCRSRAGVAGGRRGPFTPGRMLLRHANQCEHACGQHAAFLGRTSYDPNLDRKRSQLDTGRHGDRCREASTGGSALGAQGCDNYRRQ
jgi:hypothetical protein